MVGNVKFSALQRCLTVVCGGVSALLLAALPLSSALADFGAEGVSSARAVYSSSAESITAPSSIIVRSVSSESGATPLLSAAPEGVVASVMDDIRALWNLSLIEFDSSPITVGKVALAILLVTVGVGLARLLSSVLLGRILRRFHLSSGAITALQSIGFYLFASIAVLLAFNLVHIPLTIFTFLGGAAAIGFGFGSQNLASNFMSGLILLVEQPVRVGDTIEFDGIVGTVVTIGARSTMVRTGSNQDVIVPNNRLIENRVTNWTLTDVTVRRLVTVGVAYGADPRQVEKILVEIASKMPDVLLNPPPVALLIGFGASSLDFELRFWVSGRSPADAARIESEIRHQILEQFAKAGIAIPYPRQEIVVVGNGVGNG